MHSIKNEFLIRKKEIDEFLKLIESMESRVIAIPAVINRTSVNTTLKASVILLLYNLVESTLTNCLGKIHDVISTRGIKYTDVNDEIKEMIIIYYHYISEKKGSVHSFAGDIKNLISIIVHDVDISLSYEDLTKYYSLYSGNLDSRKICSIFSKYGIEFEEKIGELKTIKEYRNKLAHGEISFEECGRELSIQQLIVMNQKVNKYMDNIINTVEDFIDNDKFLCTTQAC